MRWDLQLDLGFIKTLGFIKSHLHETKGHELKNIKIIWGKNKVELNGNRVAWGSATCETNYEKAAEDVQLTVKNSVDEWN